jgi:hypothetical protein
MNFPAITDFTNARDYAASVELPYDDGGEQVDKQIYVANDTRFAASTYNQPLTTFAVGGWNNPGLDAELNALVGAPVRVLKRFNYKVWANNEAFKSETDDIRAIGAEFQEVRLGTTEVNTQTVPRGLIISVDREELSDGVISEQQYIQYLTDRLKLNQLRRAAALLLAAGAGPQARTWLTGTRDADMDVVTEINDYKAAAGIRPNTIVYGDTAWLGRMTTLRALTSAGGFAGASMNEQQLAAFFKVGQVFVSSSAYQSATATKTMINAANVLVFNKSNSGLSLDPSNIKYFYSPAPSGGQVEAFRYEVGSSKIVLGVRHNELLAITYSGGIQAMTIS